MDIKSTFIKNILNDEGRRFKSNQGRALRKELLFHSHRILRDRTVEVLSMPSNGGTLQIKTPHYTRLLDIKQNRKKRNGKGVSRRSLRIYNRYTMGAFYSIAQRVSTEFTSEVIRDIRMKFKVGGLNGE